MKLLVFLAYSSEQVFFWDQALKMTFIQVFELIYEPSTALLFYLWLSLSNKSRSNNIKGHCNSRGNTARNSSTNKIHDFRLALHFEKQIYSFR